MKTLGALYTMRQAARVITGTDPRTVFAKVQENGIPYSRVTNSIVINEAGLNRLRRVYAAERTMAKSA